MYDYKFRTDPLLFAPKRGRLGPVVWKLTLLLFAGICGYLLLNRLPETWKTSAGTHTAPTQAVTLLELPAPEQGWNRAQPPPPAELASPRRAAAISAEAGTPLTGTGAPRERQGRVGSDTWIDYTVQKGDNLFNLFKQVGLPTNLLPRILRSSKTARRLQHIKPGEKIRLHLGPQSQLTELHYHFDGIRTLQVTATQTGFETALKQATLERRINAASGVVDSSLFGSAQRRGLSDTLIMQLARIFGWDIDFALEIRAGDQFSLVFEEHWSNGHKLRDGPILAAEFVNGGRAHRAVRFRDRSGNVAYYAPDGTPMRKEFLRTPVKFSRVSSGFSLRRWHPVLKKWRAHKGVDYAAPIGTPVYAAGKGTVAFKGWKAGFGKVIFLEHGPHYTTVYGHLSNFASRLEEGGRVRQGQPIGYVGKSGLATGPHLHYEFRVNGVHRNPLSDKLPISYPLTQGEMARFHKVAQPLLRRLDSLSRTLVAEAQ